MAGVTRKSCVALFPLWSLKKTSTEAYKKFRVETSIRGHISMIKTVTIIVISMITKITNGNSNNIDY